MASSQSTTSNDVSSSRSSSSLGSSTRSARPLFSAKSLLKDPKTLFVGRHTGRRPYVESKLSNTGESDGDSFAECAGGADLKVACVWRLLLARDIPETD